MNSYIEGDVAEFFATFTDQDTGGLVDPTTVTFAYRVTNANGIQTAAATLTYTGTGVPAEGVVARTGPGNYEAQIDTTGLAGYWTIQWKSTGTGQAVAPDTGRVHPAPI